MADVLNVIADIIKQDKQQKREHNKVMREVQKKLKEKEVSEEDGPGDGDEYQKFVQTMLKKFGVKSPSELAPDKKKEFYDALDAGWEGDDEKPEPEDEERDLGARVKARMEAENEEEDEDEAPVGDQDNPDTEPEDEEDEVDVDEPSEDQIDKIADLVVQKLKDKAEDEADEEEEPESTEAEAGEEEEIDTKPKVESSIHRNPHHRGMWEEALRRVYEEKVPAPIPEIIKSVGKQLRDYALKSGGIDKDAFLRVSDVMQKGKIPKSTIIPDDTDPREFVMDLMAKTFGWKFVEQEYNMRFNRRRDYVESFQGGEVLQEHCGECGLDGLHEGPIQTKMAKSKKGKITVTDHDSLEDAKKHLADMKKKGWNGIISQDGKPIKEEDEIEEKMDGRKKNSGKQAKKDNEDRRAAQRKKLGILGPNEDHDKTECPKCKGEGCEHCDGKGYHISEETLTEDWFDNEVKKVEKKWMAKDSKGNYTMNKRAKMNWIDKIQAKADRYDMTDFELEDALDDYGISFKLKDYDKDGGYTKDALKRYPQNESNLDKLQRWGIKTQKEGYMILPAIDRDKYTPIRGMEGPFPTFSGKVLYYDPKAGQYYDRDSDRYLEYDEYLEHDKMSSSQRKQMDMGPLGDPKSKEYKAMERIKNKAEKMAKKNRLKAKNESIGMNFIRKHYQKNDE